MPGRGADRQAAEQRGRNAESLAALMLRLKGYRILARRLRTPSGEIDLLARRGNLVIIVEVKARATRDEALAALSPRQQQRLAAAAAWLPRWRPALAACDIRLDLVAVSPRRWPHHLKNAWSLG
jgi:putative endonuclease